jgi:renalase
MKNTTVIVGAGISGLLVARELASRDAQFVVLDKSRGVGGRMSTKRVGSAVFDQGAQFFTVRDEHLDARVNCWARNGVVERWPGGDEERWVARPSMTGLAKTLAKGLPVKLKNQVQAVRWHDSGCWEVDVAGGELVRGDRLVLSCPVPQSLALLEAGEVKLPSGLHDELAAVDYHPCLALLVTLDGESAVSPAGEKHREGPFRWVADNVRKGIAQNVPAAITFHVNREYSAEHYGDSEEALFEQLEPAMKPWLGDAKIVARKLHRWRFSEPRNGFEANCVWLPERKLGFCGDAFGGPRVEGAAVSGLALARKIVGDMATA